VFTHCCNIVKDDRIALSVQFQDIPGLFET